MARLTIDGIAERLGLSSAAVSYALNGQPGVSDATRARVLALAVELGWQPNASARSLSRSKADAIGLALARPAEDVRSAAAGHRRFTANAQRTSDGSSGLAGTATTSAVRRRLRHVPSTEPRTINGNARTIPIVIGSPSTTAPSATATIGFT